jgi:hypothetical protein
MIHDITALDGYDHVFNYLRQVTPFQAFHIGQGDCSHNKQFECRFSSWTERTSERRLRVHGRFDEAGCSI